MDNNNLGMPAYSVEIRKITDGFLSEHKFKNSSDLDELLLTSIQEMKIDSIDFIDLILRYEEAFEVSLDPESLSEINSLKELEEYVLFCLKK